MPQNYFGGIRKALKSEMGGCILFSDLELRIYFLWVDDMLCPGEEFQEPEQIVFRATLTQWEQQVLPTRVWGPSEGAGGDFLGVLISKNGPLALTEFLEYTFLKLLDAFLCWLEDFFFL